MSANKWGSICLFGYHINKFSWATAKKWKHLWSNFWRIYSLIPIRWSRTKKNFIFKFKLNSNSVLDDESFGFRDFKLYAWYCPVGCVFQWFFRRKSKQFLSEIFCSGSNVYNAGFHYVWFKRKYCTLKMCF